MRGKGRREALVLRFEPRTQEGAVESEDCGVMTGVRGARVVAEPRGMPTRDYFVSMKVSSVSSRASHHLVWCTGAWLPVTGDGCEWSR